MGILCVCVNGGGGGGEEEEEGVIERSKDRVLR